MDTPAPPPASSATAAALTRFAAQIDARNWDAMAATLAPGFTARFVHTGETFDGTASSR